MSFIVIEAKGNNREMNKTTILNPAVISLLDFLSNSCKRTKKFINYY